MPLVAAARHLYVRGNLPTKPCLAMKAAPLPANEAARLENLRYQEILDTPPEELFDRITRMVAHIVNAPIALVSLVDEHRQWFKSHHGIGATETPRELAFCAHAILDNKTQVVEDALLDPRFADNPLVTGDPKLRFYAGAPIKTDEGFNIGTLCVIDRVPRKLSDAHRQLIEDLAKLVADEFQLRVSLRRLAVALEQARSADAAKTQFLASMSHELRTPLNAIVGFAEALDMGIGADDAAKRSEMLNYIVTAGRHLNDLIGSVLDYAKIESGVVEVASCPVAIDDVVLEVMPVAEQLGKKAGVKLLAWKMSGAVVLGDGPHLRQVLLNLMTNAIKYNQPGGTVECRATAANGRLRLSVVDSGPGLAPEFHHRVFEPFDQLGLQQTDVPGLGVGLSISRRLVEMMRGTLEFKSEPGRGSTFWIDLPLASATTAG